MAPSPYTSLTEAHAVIEITDLRPVIWRAIRKEWPDAKRPVVILTGERRKHYLDRHPEVLGVESRLRDLIRHPDEIFRNRHDSSMAIFYQYYDLAYWIRAAVWISDSLLLRNSVFSLRFAPQEEVARDREQRFVVWRRE